MALIRTTYADAAVRAMTNAMRDDPRVVVLGEDVGRGGIFQQYKGLQAAFGPERVIDTPISEATIVGAGVGMALVGMRPVVEMRVVDFALCAMDEIVNQAAKNRYMFGGQGRVPLVMRLPIGFWANSAAQHSQSLEAWFAHLPGVVVMCPATPQDNFSMLTQALRGEDPVIYMENKELWGLEGEVDESLIATPGRANVLRRGDDLTLVSWSAAVHAAAKAADELAAQGVRASVIDLGTLWPWDRDAVQAAGFGAEVAATAAQATGCRIGRLGAPRIPVGYATRLETVARVSPAAVVEAALSLMADAPQATAA